MILSDTEQKFLWKKSAAIKVKNCAWILLEHFVPEQDLQYNMQTHLIIYFTIHSAVLTVQLWQLCNKSSNWESFQHLVISKSDRIFSKQNFTVSSVNAKFPMAINVNWLISATHLKLFFSLHHNFYIRSFSSLYIFFHNLRHESKNLAQSGSFLMDQQW